MERVHDLAYFYRWLIDALQLAPLPILGFSMGGWLAAEMVAMYPASISRMVLVGAAGIKPSVGEITDIFLITPEEVLQKQFYDPTQAPEYEQLYGREPTPEQRQIADADHQRKTQPLAPGRCRAHGKIYQRQLGQGVAEAIQSFDRLRAARRAVEQIA